jgi:hypothetical protein
MEPSNIISTDAVFRPIHGSDYRSEVPTDDSIESHDRVIGSLALFASEWHAELRAGRFGDCLFITQGGFIGKAPAKTKKGDQVCVLLGDKVPFLLRRLDQPEDFWHLVGEVCKCLTS